MEETELDRETIEVDMYNYQQATAPDTLTSGGLGPCIAVGAICGKDGFMVHYLGYVTTPDELEQMLFDLKEFNKSQLEIYVAGAGFNDDNSTEANDSIAESRKECLDVIAQAGFTENIKKIQWNKDDHSQELTLDLVTGKALYEEDPFDYINTY
ncbi:hypothetical protein GOV03_01635 [Candidatus Woesearchaeota archaeon]|nr:hypothetical protein [Candidatus Woesearchaeota archaeon]